MLSPLDYAIIIFYFLFMTGMGFLFRRSSADSSEYFRAGGVMPWWLAGCGSFMTAFSAWTFTGAAGLAYDRGLIVVTIFAANTVGFFLCAWKFAAWYRQLRTITTTEAFRQRFGITNQQIAVWIGLPLAVIRPSIWVYGLAIFLTPVFGLDLTTVIIAVGVGGGIIACLGGAWAVTASDLVQAVLLFPITLIAAFLALQHIGGFVPLFERLPVQHIDLTSSHLPGFGALWLLAVAVEKTLGQGLGTAGRYLGVADSVEARRSAVFAGLLMSMGTLVWFIPPLVARAMGIDLAVQYPQINNPAEAAYAAMAVLTLPPGLLGLLVTGIIAATFSSLDTGLNANAGTLVRGFYLPFIRPKASERELVLAGKIATLLFSLVIVAMALRYTAWKSMGVFALMFNVSAMIAMPVAVPLFWCLFTRRSPDFAYWTSMLLGFGISVTLGLAPNQSWAAAWIAGAELTEFFAWVRANEYAAILLANAAACSAWFWLVTWCRQGRRLSPQRQAEVDEFFARMHTPLPKDAVAARSSAPTSKSIGRMCYCYGAFIALIAVFSDSLLGRVGLLACATVFLIVGWGIGFAARRAPS